MEDPNYDTHQWVKWAEKRIKELESAIRTHRDCKGHDRCWLDDAELYKVLNDGVQADMSLPPKEEFLGRCALYYESRRKENSCDFHC